MTEAITSLLGSLHSDSPTQVIPAGFVRELGDRKTCYINIQAQNLGGHPFELDVKLSVEDSANSAGSVVDLIRYAAATQRVGKTGELLPACANYCKRPPIQMREVDAIRELNKLEFANS